MSSLPMLKSHKLYLYGAVIMGIGSISFYNESLKMINILDNLDTKYLKQYQEFARNTGFENIA